MSLLGVVVLHREVQKKALRCSDEGTLPPEDGSKVVSWHDRLEEVPKGPILLVAQELLDALPVHQFVYTKEGWRERLVDVEKSAEEPLHFKVWLVKERGREPLGLWYI